MADALHVIVLEAENGLVKISACRSPEQHAAAVGAESASLVRLIAAWPGKLTEVRAILRRFAARRDHGEWFRPEGEVAAFLAEVRGRGVPAILDWASVRAQDDAAARAEAARQATERRAALHRAHWSDPAYRRRQLIELRVGHAMAGIARDRAAAGLPALTGAALSAAADAARAKAADEVDAGAVPGWVERAGLRDDFLDAVRAHGPEAAASHVRRLKAEACRALP